MEFYDAAIDNAMLRQVQLETKPSNAFHRNFIKSTNIQLLQNIKHFVDNVPFGRSSKRFMDI